MYSVSEVLIVPFDEIPINFPLESSRNSAEVFRALAGSGAGPFRELELNGWAVCLCSAWLSESVGRQSHSHATDQRPSIHCSGLAAYLLLMSPARSNLLGEQAAATHQQNNSIPFESFRLQMLPSAVHRVIYQFTKREDKWLMILYTRISIFKSSYFPPCPAGPSTSGSKVLGSLSYTQTMMTRKKKTMTTLTRWECSWDNELHSHVTVRFGESLCYPYAVHKKEKPQPTIILRSAAAETLSECGGPRNISTNWQREKNP